MTPKVTIVGTINMELILAGVKNLPAWGRQSFGRNCILTAAGSGPRVAFPLSALGIRTWLIGKVGNDTCGREILKVIKNHNLDTAGVETAHQVPTGLCVSLVRPDGERTYVSFLGAVGETNAALIRRHYDLVEKSGLVLITGYWALAGFRPGVENLLRKMKSDGKLVFLDPGWNPDGWPESSRREMLRLLPLIDVFLPNYPEAKALSRKNRPEEMGKSLCRAGAGEVIIKMDDHGSAGYSEKEGFQKRNALKIKAVDTTAAGEAFNAGVIYGLIQKWPLTNRLTFANTLAGLTIADPQAPCPSLDKVLGKMKGAYAGIC